MKTAFAALVLALVLAGCSFRGAEQFAADKEYCRLMALELERTANKPGAQSDPEATRALQFQCLTYKMAGADRESRH